MIEEKITKIKNEIKAVKSSMPIAGSLLDVYFYTTKITSGVYNDGSTATTTVRFIPTNPSEGLGLTEMSTYIEILATDPNWTSYNPIFLDIDECYYPNSNGEAEYETAGSAAGIGPYNVRATASVYSTVPGRIEIDFS